MNTKIKYALACAVIVSLLLALSLRAQTIVGSWQAHVQDGNRVDYRPIKFFSEKASYAKGGVTFTYPEGYFSSNPHVCITVELKKMINNASMEISPLVTESSATELSVYVSKTIAGLFKTTVSQVEDDEVIVHILAFGF